MMHNLGITARKRVCSFALITLSYDNVTVLALVALHDGKDETIVIARATTLYKLLM